MNHKNLNSAATTRMKVAAMGGVLASAMTFSAAAQSFNIDIGGAAGAATQPPWACFEGAGRYGAWNNWNSTTLALNGLVKDDGTVSSVNLTRSSGAGGTFGFNNPANAGHYARLLNDAQDIGGVGASRTYTFSSLAAGTYEVYTYAIAPDSDALFTNVDVPASGEPVQVIGGAMPGNDLVLGVTHALHNVILTEPGSLVIIVSTHTGFGSINGIQLVHTESPAAAPLCVLSATATPSLLTVGETTLLTVEVAPGVNPPSTGIIVEADLSAIGGSPNQVFTDDGDDVYVHLATVNSGMGSVSFPWYVSDDQGRSGAGVFTLTIPAVLAPVGGVYTEVEDNFNKTLANLVLGMVAGESITGTTTGSSTTVAGTASADNFLIRTGPLPLGIYRHRLEITTSGTVGHTGTLRALTASGTVGVGGAANPGTDAIAQTSQTTVGGTLPMRTNQYYGFGKEEQVYYRIAGTGSTTAPYVVTLSTEEVTPIDIGLFQPGEITMNWIGQGHTTDTVMWVYDENLDPIPGYGNDDANALHGGAPVASSSFQSFLKRNYDPGTYYIAVSNWQMATDQPAAFDDNYQSGFVMDFPGVAVNSNTTATAVNLTFTITDSEGSVQIPLSKASRFDIVWVKFDVENPAPLCPGDLDGNGVVNVFDLLDLLSAWGPCAAPCPADLDGNGVVNVFDLLALLSAWGVCP